MKVVILAGGYGTRLGEETDKIPKPMVEIGQMPILWHIMKGFEAYGHREFVIATGYKGHVIKRFFADYALQHGSFCVQTKTGGVVHHESAREDWTVHCVDTGLDAMTGARLLSLRSVLKDDGPFFLTYGDGLSDVDLSALLKAHEEGHRAVTLTAVQPAGRFGALEFGEHDTRGVRLDMRPVLGSRSFPIRSFREKLSDSWVNAGFMVMSPQVFGYLPGPDGVLEQALGRMAERGELGGYLHGGYWQCMDTLRDKRELEKLWAEKRAPWAAHWSTR